MFKKLFGKKEAIKTVQIFAPVTGTAINLEQVPDPVFSERMMGDGIAVEPSEGEVVSPVDGEIVQVFPTKHAIGIRAQNGAEILIHIGLETVSMNGEGFEAHISVGDKVSVGDRLVSFDLELVKEKAKSTVTPIIITNTDNAAAIEKKAAGPVERGTSPVLEVTFD
ncbi:PTS glucose transporter subunit IIA [Bacillus canaveralius]|uniref:PTS glucose transporter subunit IIA n=1 Tax=Bacillus canaveralius TaxID=1403243 RepID=A0A2N5GJ12_9BACI|nr:MULTISPECIES: PTS glucose transporter subunit IIA [Bacillus]PLR81045.1 PTS glucose transporter subunit IIA [Bacillus canaveralius]PLR82762.1 PTS glucose transporter subunit IIA [Bacillus sp. V33-4]PLR98981.1 PTS glucose transporter subunit IIA [Bacillus canaveralius]RSK45427.1 PTS glucose transporter subunit IIA [Bacillus canaveralius]